jgi:hypothetical protein
MKLTDKRELTYQLGNAVAHILGADQWTEREAIARIVKVLECREEHAELYLTLAVMRFPRLNVLPKPKKGKQRA